MVEQAKVKGKDDDEVDHFALCFFAFEVIHKFPWV